MASQVVAETTATGTRFVDRDGTVVLVLTDSDYTVTTETLIEVTDVTASRVIQLPDPELVEPSTIITVKDGSGDCDSTHKITLQPAADGVSLVIATAFDSVSVYSNGSAYRVLKKPAS